MNKLAFARGGLSSTGFDRRSHQSGSFRSYGRREEKMHSEEYTAAIDRITTMMACTDIRELLKIVPTIFKGVIKIEIEGEKKSGEPTPLIGAFVDKEKVIFTDSSAKDEHFVRTDVPLSLKHANGSKEVGNMTIMSFYPLSLNGDNPNDKEETKKVLEILGSLLARTIDAKLDGLTALPVRKYFDCSLDERVSQFQESGRVFSLIMLDIDHFKAINDKHGHSVGDSVLSSIARILQNGVRARVDCTDSVFRVGGEEFAVLLPDVTREGAQAIAERLRLAIKSHEFGIPQEVTCSFGVADAREILNVDSNAVYGLADGRMYLAKNSGRDMVYPSIDGITRLSA